MAKWEMIVKMYKIRKFGGLSYAIKNKHIGWKTIREVCPKMKPGLAGILTVLAVCVLTILFGGIPVMPAIAAARTTVTLTAEGNQAEVSLELPAGDQAEQQGYDGIKALQLGFQINILQGEGADYQVSFLFDEGITSSVRQFSYQEETGLLQIYLSGEQNLYETGSITLGKIVVESEASADVTASIRVAEDSLITVNDAFDLQQQPFQAPETAQVTTDRKQTATNSGAYGGAAGIGTGNPQDKTDQSEGGTATNQSDGKEKPAGETEAAIGDDGTPEQEPLLRLVETGKRNPFSLKHFSFQNLLADKKIRIVLGVVSVAAAALILGMITRFVHNRKKKKKKTWW